METLLRTQLNESRVRTLHDLYAQHGLLPTSNATRTSGLNNLTVMFIRLHQEEVGQIRPIDSACPLVEKALASAWKSIRMHAQKDQFLARYDCMKHCLKVSPCELEARMFAQKGSSK